MKIKILLCCILPTLCIAREGLDLIFWRNGARSEVDVLELYEGKIEFSEAGGVLRTASLDNVLSISFRRPRQNQELNPLREGGLGALHLSRDFDVRGSLGTIGETEEEKAELAEWIRTIFDRPVQSVLLTRSWGHPMDQSVAAVRFRPKEIHGVYYMGGTSLISHRALTPKRLAWDEEARANWGPGETDHVFGDWFTDGEIKEYLLVSYVVGGKRIFLSPPGRDATYTDISTLLNLIHARDIPVHGELEFPLELPLINVEEIISVDARMEDGGLRYHVKTRGGELSGRIFIFEKQENGFVMIGTGLWVS